jgi:phosphate transport system substrate-binding protein
MDRPMIAIAAVTVLGFVSAVGCGSEPSPEERTVSADAPKNVIGPAGSTFVFPLMTAWIDGYQQAHPGFVVNYRPTRSGAGIEEFKRGMVNFAASDAPLTDAQIRDIPTTLQVPVTAGPICFIYNLPGLARPLRLSSATLAGIFLGTIINWEDPAIARDNPGVNFPRAAVIVIHRSDGSGTTKILTAYLSKVSKEWSSKVGEGLSV